MVLGDPRTKIKKSFFEIFIIFLKFGFLVMSGCFFNPDKLISNLTSKPADRFERFERFEKG